MKSKILFQREFNPATYYLIEMKSNVGILMKTKEAVTDYSRRFL